MKTSNCTSGLACVQALAVCAALLFSAAAAGLLAQTITGTILGVITDPSGGAIPDVQITATNEATDVRNVASNAHGEYTIPQLAPGNYTVQATAPDFLLPRSKRWS